MTTPAVYEGVWLPCCGLITRFDQTSTVGVASLRRERGEREGEREGGGGGGRRERERVSHTGLVLHTYHLCWTMFGRARLLGGGGRGGASGRRAAGGCSAAEWGGKGEGRGGIQQGGRGGERSGGEPNSHFYVHFTTATYPLALYVSSIPYNGF